MPHSAAISIHRAVRPCSRHPVAVRSNASRKYRPATGPNSANTCSAESNSTGRARSHGSHGPVVLPRKSGAMSSTTSAETSSGRSAARHHECKAPIECPTILVGAPSAETASPRSATKRSVLIGCGSATSRPRCQGAS
ncbi:Uncharacterised protein [Mycobacterium tuberculosis]|uniref:Uncharacterized protein n=1 Tax=Mycobacterium tuberculosis TaxID=1773 RepID=A0A0U0RZU4_MYCTX|nr:Uncharacterised protein [Mycobacterium tuberculosis]